MDVLKQKAKIFVFGLYFLLLVGVSGKLFFEQQFDALVRLVGSLFPEKQHSLVIGFAEPLLSLDPLANDTGSRSRLLHIYEGLVAVSGDLSIRPGLALSFGALDDFTWEFKLRPGVLFHSGRPLTMDDVEVSLQAAKNDRDSKVRDLASTIREIKPLDAQRIRIITHAPDPLFLQKIAALFIFPKDAGAGARPVGTGPYVLEKNDRGALVLKRFEPYWGEKPAFERVTLQPLVSREEKLAALKNRSVDILANLPADIAHDFSYPGFRLQTFPSLEVNFLMFHFDGLFRRPELRRAVRLALDIGQLGRLAQGFSLPATQFVADGIFGYNPDIAAPIPDIAAAGDLVQKIAGAAGPVRLTLDLPGGLEAFGESVRGQLKRIGMVVELRYHAPDELGRLITSRKSDFFFFGWRSEMGDASDFLTAVVHSPGGGLGQFNGGNYRSSETDRWIELSRETLQPDVRLSNLRAVMEKITVDDVIGIPLFSPEVLYAVSRKADFKPRVDGYVLAQEVE